MGKRIKKIRSWHIMYLLCSLIYMGWVIHAGANEFDRINGQYRKLVARLEPERIRLAALEELRDEWCGKHGKQTELAEGDCKKWEPAAAEIKEREVAKRFQQARERGLVKAVLFYLGFVLIFLLLPPLLLFMLITGAILLYRNIRIVR